MHIGIKFCGGCNSAYDRGAACARIKEAFAAPPSETGHEKGGERGGNGGNGRSGRIQFSGAESGQHYDILLVISGCSARCADISGYRFDHVVSLWRGDGVDEAVAEIRALAGLSHGGT